jgi:hypothetical protein
LRRRYQAATETISQASDAPTKAPGMLLSTSSEKATAKASSPSAHRGAAEREADHVFVPSGFSQ